MTDLKKLAEKIARGDCAQAVRLTQDAVEAGISPRRILDEGLIAGMHLAADDFKRNKAFVPEMFMAARAMNQAMALVEPLLVKAHIKPTHTAVIGTVEGDIHDIGKNLVALMLRGAELAVVDLGVNVPAGTFIEAARKHRAELIGLSAFLTTTLPAMQATVKAIRKARLKSKVIIGGAPVTQEFCDQVGADGYAPDAARAIDLVAGLLGHAECHV